MTNNKIRWILPIPFLIFGVGAWLYLETENEVRVQVDRAKVHWRKGNYSEAAKLFEFAYETYPESQYVENILWEIANISYTNLHEVDRAVEVFLILVARYPEGPLTPNAYLKLAEIHEVELNDPTQAIEYLTLTLALDVTSNVKRRVHFQLGSLYLKLNQFQDALLHLEILAKENPKNHLAQQARARVGKIHQIQKEFSGSISYFQEVVDFTSCKNCKVEALLGLIESYEFLGELTKAIEKAEEIPSSTYPLEMKKELLKGLENRLQYYGPTKQQGEE